MLVKKLIEKLRIVPELKHHNFHKQKNRHLAGCPFFIKYKPSNASSFPAMR